MSDQRGTPPVGSVWDGTKWIPPQTATPPSPSPSAFTPGASTGTDPAADIGFVWDGRTWIRTTPPSGRKNGMGVASLVIGIIAIPLCGGGIILPILAITFGWTGMKRAKQGLATNGGVAKAGFILGWVAAGIGIVVGLMYVVSLATGGTSTTLDPSSVERELNAGLVQELGGQYSVDCPSIIVVQAGGTFSCDVTSLPDGATGRMLVTQDDDQGNLSWEIASAN